MLDVQNVSVAYGPITALRGVSFHVAAGSVCAVVGSNGAGKSTLMKALCGLVPLQAGQLTLEGRDITTLPTHERTALGLALSPEGRRLFPELTTYENLLMGAYLRKDKAGIRADIDRVYGYFPRLAERVNSQGRHLSGGEQQMCAIGRALMSRPKVLLLDEPSLGLAPSVILDVAKAIRRISEDGTTIMLVEQNARLALKLSQHAIVLETGSLVLQGPSSELIHDPYVTAAYLGG